MSLQNFPAIGFAPTQAATTSSVAQRLKGPHKTTLEVCIPLFLQAQGTGRTTCITWLATVSLVFLVVWKSAFPDSSLLTVFSVVTST